MGQQGSSASNLRTGKDESGFKEYSKGKTDKPETSRGNTKAKAFNAYAGWKGKPLETHHVERVAKTIAWEVRCPELSPKSWEGRYGPEGAHAMARYMAEIIDHDEARVMGFGGKKITLELRTPGRDEIQVFELTGEPKFRYSANKVSK